MSGKIPKINIPCPNCKNVNFVGFSKGEYPLVAISSARKEEDGDYALNQAKSLGLVPIYCDKCGYVMFFNENII